MTSCACDPEDGSSLLSSSFVGRSSDFSVSSELGSTEYAQVPLRPLEPSKAGSGSFPLLASSRMPSARPSRHTPSEQCAEGLESAPWRVLSYMTRFEWLSLDKAPGEPARLLPCKVPIQPCVPGKPSASALRTCPLCILAVCTVPFSGRYAARGRLGFLHLAAFSKV